MECLISYCKSIRYLKRALPAQIHVHISADGYKSYGTEFLFDDDERWLGISGKVQQEQLPGLKTGKVFVSFCATVYLLIALAKTRKLSTK